MDPSLLMLKPYQDSFDTLLNPGRRYKKAKGNQFFYQYIRLHINRYPHATNKFLFRKQILHDFVVLFQRGLYWFDCEEDVFIPVLSFGLAARCSRKIFENIQGFVYRSLPRMIPLMCVQRKKNQQCTMTPSYYYKMLEKCIN